MGNINTYLSWRGDLNFTEHPFCEADNLALAVLSYLDLAQIVPPNENEILLCHAYEKYQDLGRSYSFHSDTFRTLFSTIAESRRFGKAKLSWYREIFDEQRATQFAAIQITLEDGTAYLSFRGTDHSIVGWEEDFEMGSQVVPAQLAAARYLNEVMIPGRQYRIGGHSKGGNLAIYASLHCKEELAASVLAVYNNDGPGLSRDIVPQEAFQKIDDKLIWIIPEYSVVGTLFPHRAPTKIVASSADGLLQHDPFSWQIEGEAFVEKEQLTDTCRFYVDILDTWISSADLGHRSAFTRDFFSALKAGGAKTIEDVMGSGVDGFGTILLSIASSESRTKIVIARFVKAFWHRCRKINVREVLRTKEALHGVLFLIAGLYLMLFPEAALRLTGTITGIAAIIYWGKRLLSSALNDEMDHRQKKLRILSCLAVMGVVELLIINKTTVLISSHVVLGVLLLLVAFRCFSCSANNRGWLPKRVLTFVSAIVLVLLGIVSLTSSDEKGALIFTLGTFLVAYSVFVIARAMYKDGVRRTDQSNLF